MSAPSIPDPATRRVRGSGCPLCGRPIASAHRPFCGQGCRDRDLLAWLGDGYRVPGRAVDQGTDDSNPDALDSDRAPPL